MFTLSEWKGIKFLYWLLIEIIESSDWYITRSWNRSSIKRTQNPGSLKWVISSTRREETFSLSYCGCIIIGQWESIADRNHRILTLTDTEGLVSGWCNLCYRIWVVDVWTNDGDKRIQGGWENTGTDAGRGVCSFCQAIIGKRYQGNFE